MNFQYKPIEFEIDRGRSNRMFGLQKCFGLQKNCQNILGGNNKIFTCKSGPQKPGNHQNDYI